jgi:hypothetical protein
MSKGLGRVQREIDSIFRLEPEGAFTVEDLCWRIYVCLGEKRHRVAVIRAAKAVAKRHPGIHWWRSERAGSTLIFFHHDDVISYALARLKSDPWCDDDDKVLWQKLGKEEYQELVKPGGSWWLHVQEWTAKRDNDAARLEELKPLLDAQQKRLDASAASLRQALGT